MSYIIFPIIVARALLRPSLKTKPLNDSMSGMKNFFIKSLCKGISLCIRTGISSHVCLVISCRNIVDASALRDIKDASALDNYVLPKLYLKMHYCIEAAVHQRIVRVRSSENRRIRAPPVRGRR